MTKQEEIREVIEAYTDDDCLYSKEVCAFRRGEYCISEEGAYKCLMKRLDELGVVIKGSKHVEADNLYYIEPLIKE